MEFSLPYRLGVFPRMPHVKFWSFPYFPYATSINHCYGVSPPVYTWSFPSLTFLEFSLPHATLQIINANSYGVFPPVYTWSFPSRTFLEFSLPHATLQIINANSYGVFPPVYTWSFPSRTFWSFPSPMPHNKNINPFLLVELCIYIAFNIFWLSLQFYYSNHNLKKTNKQREQELISHFQLQPQKFSSTAMYFHRRRAKHCFQPTV